MKFNNFASFVRKQTKTDSTSFSNNDLVLFSNIAKDYIAEEIVQLDEDYFDLTLTTNLLAGQREYSFPVDMLKNMKMLEINMLTQEDIDWNAANPSLAQRENWKRVKEFDLNSFRKRQSIETKNYSVLDVRASFSNATTNEENIIETFSNDYPLFDIDGESMFIYTGSEILSVSGGLKLKAVIYPADYEVADFSLDTDMSIRSSNTSTALPRPSHEVLARKTIMLFKEANQITLDSFDNNFFNELQLMKNKLKDINLDKTVIPTIHRDSGYNY